jgi:hypothetical protein
MNKNYNILCHNFYKIDKNTNCEFWRALNFLKKSSQKIKKHICFLARFELFKKKFAKNKKAYLLFGALFAKSA